MENEEFHEINKNDDYDKYSKMYDYINLQINNINSHLRKGFLYRTVSIDSQLEDEYNSLLRQGETGH